MAIIASKVLWWAMVSDASTYRVRITADGAVTPDGANLKDFPYDVITPSGDSLAEIEFDIANVSSVVISEGIYDVFISAVDEAGNESDPLLIADALLDFQPPAAPSNGGWR